MIIRSVAARTYNLVVILHRRMTTWSSGRAIVTSGASANPPSTRGWPRCSRLQNGRPPDRRPFGYHGTMTPIGRNGAVDDDEPVEAVLTFHEQADGRKVARLPGGKVVLLDLHQMHRVADGERWSVRLRHKETFAIAEPLDLAREALIPNPVLRSDIAERLSSLVAARPARPVEGTPPAPGPPAEAPEPKPAVVAPAPPAPPPAPQPVPAPKPPAAVSPREVIRAADRVALFVDGANMDGACRAAAYFVDYRKAREFFLAAGQFYAGFYYIADFTASDPLQQRYLDFLSHAGYIVRRRPVKVIRDQDTGERIIKGNLDTEIVLDMLNTVGNYDVAYLFSGDSDFERAVDLLRSRGKRIYVVTARSQLSRELAYVADKPIFFIEEYADTIGRDDRAPGPAR